MKIYYLISFVIFQSLDSISFEPLQQNSQRQVFYHGSVKVQEYYNNFMKSLLPKHISIQTVVFHSTSLINHKDLVQNPSNKNLIPIKFETLLLSFAQLSPYSFDLVIWVIFILYFQFNIDKDRFESRNLSFLGKFFYYSFSQNIKQIDFTLLLSKHIINSFAGKKNDLKTLIFDLNVQCQSLINYNNISQDYQKMTSDHQIMELGNINPLFYQFYQPIWYHQFFQQFPTFFCNNSYNPNFLANEISKDLTQSPQEQNHYLVQNHHNNQDQGSQRPQRHQTSKKKKRTDANYLNKYQKQDRNLNSIVLRNFVNFVNSHPRISDSIELIISNKNLDITAFQYLELFKDHLPSKQSYVGVTKMKSFIDMGNQNNAIKIITLILLRKFIDTDFFTVLINCKKVSRSAREKELKHGKKFWKFFVKQVL